MNDRESPDDKVRQSHVPGETGREQKYDLRASIMEFRKHRQWDCEEDNLQYLSSVGPFSNDSARDLGECFWTHRRLYLEVDGSELDGLSFGVVEGGVQGVRADGRVEDGGLLAGRGGLVRSRFGQHRDGMLWRLNGGGLQQLACGPLGTLTLKGHKLLLLLLVLLNQGVRLNLSVRWNGSNNNIYFNLWIQLAAGFLHPQTLQLCPEFTSQGDSSVSAHLCTEKTL